MPKWVNAQAKLRIRNLESRDVKFTEGGTPVEVGPVTPFPGPRNAPLGIPGAPVAPLPPARTVRWAPIGPNFTKISQTRCLYVRLRIGR